MLRMQGGDYYSAIKNGMFWGLRPLQFDAFLMFLNEFGLFVRIEHAIEYERAFRAVVASEAHSEFSFYEMHFGFAAN